MEAKSYYIAQTKQLFDIGRDGSYNFSEWEVLGVYDTLADAKAALDAADEEYGKVLEIVNPILMNEQLVAVPPRNHAWINKKDEAEKRARAKAKREAAKAARAKKQAKAERDAKKLAKAA